MNAGPHLSLNAKNFSEAFKITSQKWFPCAPGTLTKIRARITSGHYRDNRSDLLHDVQSDAALFLYSLCKLRKLLGASAASAVVGKEQMDEMLIDSIGDIVGELDSRILNHSVDSISDVQAARYKEMILAASTTDALAEKLSVNRNVGFTCALLRQLGLTLIAWNYPNIYRQSIQMLAAEPAGSGADLDSILHSQLGFSPAMLGIRFAEVSGLPDSIVKELSVEQLPRVGVEKLVEYAREGRPGVIAHLCAIGEAFARANNPQFYPNAKDDLDRAARAISQILGPDGTNLIVERTRSIYSDVVPAVFGPGPLVIDGLDGDLTDQSANSGNIYVATAPPKLKTKIQAVYQKINSNRIDEDLVRELIHQIIPSMGFNSVVVFTADPTTSSLSPVLRVGRPQFIPVRQVALTSTVYDQNPVRRAYSSGLLVYESGHLENGERRSLVATAMGATIRVGVLYLETGPIPAADGYRTDPVHAAKLLGRCLEDLLHLN
jgi:hypothetical protein